MPVTKETFIQDLLEAVPEARPTVEEHLHDNDELLLHLLMADLLRLAVGTSGRDERDLTKRLLAFVDRALREGDDAVENAVRVSFIEHVGAGEGESEAFIASWPSGLQEEMERQRVADRNGPSGK
jgi:hypothetical protein